MKLNHFVPLVLILFVNIKLATGQNQSRVYDFPIKPGTKEWESLGSYEEELNAYNIPTELLKYMNTADLVRTCLDYPEFRLIMTRNSFQEGYDYLKSIFNGFRELERRKDVGAELIKEYKKLNPADIKNFDTPLKKGKFSFSIKYIEILLSQRPIIATMDNKNQVELLKLVILNYNVIQKMPEDYATFGLMTPALVIARMLDVISYQDFTTRKSVDNILRDFVDYSYGVDINTLSDIISFAKAYLNQIENE